MSPSMPIVIGFAVGGVAALAILALLACTTIRRRRRRKAIDTPHKFDLAASAHSFSTGYSRAHSAPLESVTRISTSSVLYSPRCGTSHVLSPRRQDSLRMHRLVTLQGGSVSNNALWNECSDMRDRASDASTVSFPTGGTASDLDGDGDGTLIGTGHSEPVSALLTRRQCACRDGAGVQVLNASMAADADASRRGVPPPAASAAQIRSFLPGPKSSSAAVRTRHVFQFDSETFLVQQAMVEAAAGLMPHLTHPNVLRTYGHSCCVLEDPGDGCVCSFEVTLAQAHCNGGGLQQALRKGLFCRTMVREQWAVAAALLRNVAEGMHFLHSQGICHGSLRPACILLNRDVATHWSIASALASGEATALITGFLTCPHHTAWKGGSALLCAHSAPEVLSGGRVDKFADVYSFGVIMWQLMMGCPVVHSKPIQQSGALQEAPCAFPDVLPTCPLTYTLLMKACMSRNTADRPSFAQMLQIFSDMNRELSQDRYVDATGTVQLASQMLRPISGLPLRTEAPDSEDNFFCSGAILYGESSADAYDAQAAPPPPTPPAAPAQEFSFLPPSNASAATAVSPLPDVFAPNCLYSNSEHESSCSLSASKTASVALDVTFAELEMRADSGANSRSQGSAAFAAAAAPSGAASTEDLAQSSSASLSFVPPLVAAAAAAGPLIAATPRSPSALPKAPSRGGTPPASPAAGCRSSDGGTSRIPMPPPPGRSGARAAALAAAVSGSLEAVASAELTPQEAWERVTRGAGELLDEMRKRAASSSDSSGGNCSVDPPGSHEDLNALLSEALDSGEGLSAWRLSEAILGPGSPLSVMYLERLAHRKQGHCLPLPGILPGSNASSSLLAAPDTASKLPSIHE
eukprot:jgi/Ulvmu1/10389/UM061_0073.1